MSHPLVIESPSYYAQGSGSVPAKKDPLQIKQFDDPRIIQMQRVIQTLYDCSYKAAFRIVTRGHFSDIEDAVFIDFLLYTQGTGEYLGHSVGFKMNKLKTVVAVPLIDWDLDQTNALCDLITKTDHILKSYQRSIEGS